MNMATYFTSMEVRNGTATQRRSLTLTSTTQIPRASDDSAACSSHTSVRRLSSRRLVTAGLKTPTITADVQGR
jgi:hypothetical protein